MLIQFRVQNHRSLRDEQRLSLVAQHGGDEQHTFQPKGIEERLVSLAAIYGANASGKSNVLGALAFMRSAVLESQRVWDVEGGIPQEPFLLSAKMASAPSLYEADILVDDVRYRYGFALSGARIEEEWLLAWPHGRSSMLFERTRGEFSFGKSLHGENEAIRGLTRENSLFLSAAAQNNHSQLIPIFREFARWRFSMRRQPMARRWTSNALARAFTSDADRGSMTQLLQNADTGIISIRVEEEMLKNVAGESLPRASLYFQHRSDAAEPVWFPVHAESAGTLALLDLAPQIVGALRNGGLLCVDEMEASLHPTLALNILRMFSNPLTNQQDAQLVFATHDTNLLGSLFGERPLRRDQVWFTEKDQSGATELYPLTDFRPRKEENLERGYIQGRYGAIPFLGDFFKEPLAKKDS